MTYRVNTPGPSFTRPTLKEAKRAAHAGLDSIAAKRGYTMTESTRREGKRFLHYITVCNSKGRIVTGAVIYKVDDNPALPRYKKLSKADRKRYIEKVREHTNARRQTVVAG